MFLAGIDVRDKLIVPLAGILRDAGFVDTAERLETAYDREVRVLGLSPEEREEILRVLDDPPEGLTQLRAVLLSGFESWKREGL